MRRLRRRNHECAEGWADGWAEGEGKGGVRVMKLIMEKIKGKKYAVFYFTGKRKIFFIYL
jgi:hypothetical protein